MAIGINITYRVLDYIDYDTFGTNCVWENYVTCYDWSQVPTNETIQIISVEN